MEPNALHRRNLKPPVHDDIPIPTSPVQPLTPDKPRYGTTLEIVRLVLLVNFWMACTLTAHFSQLVYSPMYFINQNYYYAGMALFKQQYGVFLTLLTQWFAPISVVASGDESVKGQLRKSADGRLETDFPERVVLIANHQLYTDWLYIWWLAYTSRMHGHMYIVLKEVFKYVPIIGPAMQLFGFIFMSRKWTTDKARMAHRLTKLTTSHSGPMSGSAGLDPMWLLIYPEGTNMSGNTRKNSAKWAAKAGIDDLKHQVLPRSTGLHFVLSQLKGTVDYVYDITVGYGGIPAGKYGQDIFGLRSTYIAGRPPSSLHFYFRKFVLADIPLEDPKEFEAWVLARWREKDELLEQWKNTGKFPASDGWVEADIKLKYTAEILTIWLLPAVLTLLAYFGASFWNLARHGSFCFNCV